MPADAKSGGVAARGADAAQAAPRFDPREALSGLARERSLWRLLGLTPAELRAYARRGAAAEARVLDGVETLCLFIGYPRSGHSLVGSLLDAHPEIAISHELDALLHLKRGLPPRHILYLMLELARRHAPLRRRWGDYDYAVPGQWQGRFSTLRVIGDKKGGMTTLRIARDPRLLQRTMTAFGKRKRFVHVLRNPYDNIAAMTLKGYQLRPAIRDYFLMHRTNEAIIEHVGADAVATVYHEDIAANPKRELTALCTFLGVEATADYLDACASVVFSEPRRSRERIDWPKDVIADVARRMARHPLLARYRFEA
ncbi:MAG: sulfotransferase family protein [Pseudomonadota bacterium]